MQGHERERVELIVGMLDKIYPFEPDMTPDERSATDLERQSLAIRAGWTSMSIEELRQVAAGRQL